MKKISLLIFICVTFLTSFNTCIGQKVKYLPKKTIYKISRDPVNSLISNSVSDNLMTVVWNRDNLKLIYGRKVWATYQVDKNSIRALKLPNPPRPCHCHPLRLIFKNDNIIEVNSIKDNFSIDFKQIKASKDFIKRRELLNNKELIIEKQLGETINQKTGGGIEI